MAIIINGSNTPTAGAVAVGDGTTLAFTTAGTTSQVLQSNGSSTPTWTSSPFLDAIDFNDVSLPAVPDPAFLRYNAGTFFGTNDAQSDYGLMPLMHIFRLDSAGSAIGPTIANFFGANSALQLNTSSLYFIEAELYFTKTTAGTVTVTLTSSAAPQNVNGILQTGAIAGGTAVGAANQIALFNSTSTAAAFGATGSLTTGVNHAMRIRMTYSSNASTAPNIRFNVTSSAGTVTPLAGSYYRVTRMQNAISVGTFVA